MLTEDCGVADMLRETHFSGSVVDLDPERVPEKPENDRKCDVYGFIGVPCPGAPVDDDDHIRKTVTAEKVKAALESFGSYNAAEPDEFSPIVLQNLPMDVIHKILELFRASLMLDYIPTHWKRASVVFIPKQGKSNHADPKAFRPITLASFQLKTLEKLILWETQDTALAVKPLSKHQHVFSRAAFTFSAVTIFLI